MISLEIVIDTFISPNNYLKGVTNPLFAIFIFCGFQFMFTPELMLVFTVYIDFNQP